MPHAQTTALIFDLDNTLIHSHIDFLALRHRLIDVLQAHRVTDHPREILVRLALPELVGLARGSHPTLAAHMWDIIREAEVVGLTGAEAVEYAEDVLGTLHTRGYRLALLTNNARQGVAERLAALNLASHFEAIVTRDEGAALKPSPEGIHQILALLRGVEVAYLIGDAWIDGRAAEAAGIRFIGFGQKAADIVARGITPWAWITDLRELLTLNLSS